MSADYLVDFTAKTISSPRKKAPIYTVKGVLVYRYRSHLERTGINITNSYDESYLESRVSAFGPNGEVGMVISSD